MHMSHVYVRPPCMCGAHRTFSCINYVTISRHRLTCTCIPSLYGFSAYVYVNRPASLMGFLTVSKTSEALWGCHAVSHTSKALWGFACRFADEWSLMGFADAVSQTSEALLVFHTVSWWVTPFGIFSSFHSDGHLLSFGNHSRRLDHYVCVWPFEYVFIYLFIYSFT